MITIDSKELHNTDLPTDLPDWLDGRDEDQVDSGACLAGIADDTAEAYSDARPKAGRMLHRQSCPSCNGTGLWQGRTGYSCYPCNGLGYLEFASTPEQRQRNRARSAERKEQKAVDNLQSFEESFPQFKAWWTDSKFEFAISLRESARKYGKLTDRQMAAAQKCMDALEARQAEHQVQRDNAPAVSIEAIEECFKTASSRLQRPRLNLAGLVFSHAPATGKNAGALYVKRSQDGTYLGKIMGGKLFRSRDCDEHTEAEIVKVAAEPKEAAIAYGRLTGACAICNRRLDNAESVERGIGPICASKFGW